MALLQPSWDRGILTNGPLARRLEDEVADLLGVRHAVAVSSCTAGLMLLFRVLDVDGPVLVPSFTFSASAHAVVWAGTNPRFVECDPTTFQIDVDDAAARLDGAGAILATHVFGAPCRPEAVEALGRRAGIPVAFDAAHALGADRRGRRVGGFGVAEVFSLTPTKPLVAGEGGIVATDDDGLADAIRLAREYGNPGDYDTRMVGLNGRMSELHAATAVAGLDGYDARLDTRRRMAERYCAALAGVPGISVQEVDPDDASTWKDFTIAVDQAVFGVDRDTLRRALTADGVDTRCYFDPPVHRQQSYAHLPPVDLPVTDDTAARVVSLPLYAALADAEIDQVVELLTTIHRHAEELRAAAAA
jgi:dTDP-4-amino-4,6-dideoxygalactose transaminase